MRVIRSYCWLFVGTLLFTASFGLGSATISAQEGEPNIPLDPIIVLDEYVINLQWSQASDQLVFEEFDPTGPTVQTTKVWYTIQIGADAAPSIMPVTQTDVLQAQANTLSVDSQIPPVAQAQGRVGLVHPSPNGRYQAYPASHPDGGLFSLVLVDTQTSTLMFFNDIRFDGLNTRDVYTIDWSDDSSVLTVQSSTMLFYITNFAERVEQATIDQLEYFEVDGQIIGVSPHTTDLSADGTTLLYRGSRPLSLVVAGISEDTPTESRVLYTTDTRIIDASFTADDESVVFVDGYGLQRIDLETGKVSMLDASINSSWIDRGSRFSPDGSRLAILGEISGNTGDQAVYVIDVPQ